MLSDKQDDTIEIKQGTRIVVDFEGWLKVDPEKIRFVRIMDDTEPNMITGTDYLKLSEDEQENYVLESLSLALKEAEDVTFGYLRCNLEERA